jgi:molybdopterin-guanine dinucleotide biosynthesis protein A
VADRSLTGILLVGGASTRFGSPKALARIGDRTLAELTWDTLAFCDERLAVGKNEDELNLPFPVLDDDSTVRAPLAGLVGGLRSARHDLCVVLPVDTPLVPPEVLQALADACVAAAAVPTTGPLPGAYRKSSLPAYDRRLAAGRLSIRDALEELEVVTVEVDPRLLANVNAPADLALLADRALS